MKKILFFIITLGVFQILTFNLYSQLTDKWDYYPAGLVLQDDPLAGDFTARTFAIYDSNHYVALQFYYRDEGEFYPGTNIKKSNAYRGIVKTEDGGLNWTQISNERIVYSTVIPTTPEQRKSNRNRSIAYPSKNTIIVVGDSTELLKFVNQPGGGAEPTYKFYGKILITHNGGQTWEKRLLDSNTQAKDIIMLDEQKGILLLQSIGNTFNSFPSSYKLLYTEDCWSTYKEIYQSDTSKYFYSKRNTIDNRLAFPNQNKIAILPDKQTILLSEDLGANWHSVSIPGYEINNITFLDEKIGYIQANDTTGKLFKTTDGGYTWTMIFDNMEGGNNLQYYSIYDENNYMLIGSFENKSSYKRTTDGGKTWELGYLGYWGDIRYINPSYMIQFGYDFINKYRGQKQLVPPFEGKLIRKDSSGKYEVDNTIRWNRVEGATKYMVNYWGRFYTADYGQMYVDRQRKHQGYIVTRDTSVDVQLWYSSTYGFSIIAMNDLANGSMNSEPSNGPPSCRTVAGNLEMPIIYSPPVGHPYELDIQDSLQLRWSRVEGATTYDVMFLINRGYIITDTLNYSNILILIDYPDTSYTVDTFEPNTGYKFLVAAASHNDHSTFRTDIFKTPKILSVKNIVQGGDNLIYPNPVRDRAGLRVYINKPVQAEIKLSDYNGNMRSLWQGILSEGKNEIELDVADVPRGFYNIILDYGRGNYVFKFIKE